MNAPATQVRRPRVGIDFHTFDGKFQGSRSHLLGLYREAIALAPDIDFVFLLGDPEALSREHPAFRAANVELKPMTRRSSLARLTWQLPLMQRMHRLDLLHLQYRLPFVRTGAYACTVHDILFETHPEHFPSNFRRLLHWTGRTAVHRSELLFTVSDYTRGEMARLYEVPADRIALTCNGVDTQRFRPAQPLQPLQRRASDAGRVEARTAARQAGDGAGLVRALGLEPGDYLCTVGRIEPRKNHLNLLRAYALMPTPRPPLVIVGQPDPEFGEVAVRAEARRLGVDGEVRFLESIGDAELPALLRHARLFVYPSLAEGFGMPVLEAMASGVAVVTSNTTTLPEVAGTAALTVNPEDPTEIAAAMLCLLADPQRRGALVQRGLKQAARYNWRSAAQALVDSYRAHFARQAEVGCRVGLA